MNTVRDNIRESWSSLRNRDLEGKLGLGIAIGAGVLAHTVFLKYSGQPAELAYPAGLSPLVVIAGAGLLIHSLKRRNRAQTTEL